MSSFAQWCHRLRFAVLGIWIAAFVVLAIGTLGAGSAFNDDVEMPAAESSTAYQLLAKQAGSGQETHAGKIVWTSENAAIAARSVKSDAQAMLKEVSRLPGVVSVASPYRKGVTGQISAEQSTAYATVVVTDDVDVDAVRDAAESMESSQLDVALGSGAFTEQTTPSRGGEVVGLLAALAVLLVLFRSAWAAVLPILTGLVGVGTSLLVILLASHVVSIPSTSITMASLIGLGVGIDYALFIVHRFRKGLVAGKSVNDALIRALDTSGRAVIFAGLTVVAALVGMFVIPLSLLTSMAMAAAVTVVFTVLAATTLLPPVLGILKHRVLSKKQRAGLAAGAVAEEPVGRTRARRWASCVERRPLAVAVAGAVLLTALAAPAIGMRVGNSDPSSDPAGSAGKEYADMMAPAFGEGVDATLLLVAEAPDAKSRDAFNRLITAVSEMDAVARVAASPAAPDQEVLTASVAPTSSAQTEETQELVHELRDQVIPQSESGTTLRVYVGGETATNIDMSDALMERLPIYLGLIALLGFLLLAVAFRSIVVPLVGAISNLVTILVGLGVVTTIFQMGFGSELLGVGTGAPVMYLVPVMLVGVLFGLSMDYQVFLVSRMREEWGRVRNNATAVTTGLHETLPVIVTAAMIMVSVFASFGFSGERIVSSLGIGMGLAVLADAFILRLGVIPAIMHLIGSRNWSFPRWVERITPSVSIEGAPEQAAHSDEAQLVDEPA